MLSAFAFKDGSIYTIAAIQESVRMEFPQEGTQQA